LAARAVARTLGPAAGFALFAVLLAFTDLFIGTTMTESLGVVFGALGFAALWRAVSRRDAALALAGVALLVLGFAARPGPIMVAVLIPIWLAYYLRGSHRLNWGLLGVSAAILVLGTAINYMLVAALGGETGNVNGNSSLIVYGMARGLPGWDLQHTSWNVIFADYPNLKHLSDVEINQFAARKAREELLGHPVRFTVTAAKSAANYADITKTEVLNPIHSRGLRWLVLAVTATVALFFLARRWRTSRAAAAIDAVLFVEALAAVPVVLQTWPPSDHLPSWLALAIAAVAFFGFVVRGTERLGARPHVLMTVTAMVGFLVSMPFLGVDTVRIFGGATAFVGAVLALAVASVTGRPTGVEQATDGRVAAWAPAILGGALTITLLAGTPIAMAMVSRPSATPPRCANGKTAQPLFGGVAVTIVPDGTASPLPVTQVRADRYLADTIYYLPVNRVLDSIRPPFTVLEGLTASGHDRVAFLSGAHAAPQRSVTYLCGATIHDAAADELLQIWPQPIDFFRATSAVTP
ncbi:MAG TPA: hypothetical protein VGU73_10990, partial [Acidimicrobiia bacterium]|nr:hypothetical protein [Acidimicrobiia bacterium]